MTALAECHALEALRVDSCPFLRSLEPIKYVRALRELHCGYSGVRPDVLVAWLRARERDADARGVTAEPLCRNADLESVQHDAHLLRARAEHWSVVWTGARGVR